MKTGMLVVLGMLLVHQPAQACSMTAMGYERAAIETIFDHLEGLKDKNVHAVESIDFLKTNRAMVKYTVNPYGSLILESALYRITADAQCNFSVASVEVVERPF